MKAYEDYFSGKLEKHELSDEEIKSSLSTLNTPSVGEVAEMMSNM